VGKSRRWVWAVVAGVAVVAAGSIAIGVTLGTMDRYPEPTFGRVDAR
jgi:hypothetical protein